MITVVFYAFDTVVGLYGKGDVGVGHRFSLHGKANLMAIEVGSEYIKGVKTELNIALS